MLPTLLPGTYVIGLRWFLKPRAGRVVVFEHDGREVVKRIDNIQVDGLYVLGDHGIASTDSRHYGLVSVESVQSVVIWPRVSRRA